MGVLSPPIFSGTPNENPGEAAALRPSFERFHQREAFVKNLVQEVHLAEAGPRAPRQGGLSRGVEKSRGGAFLRSLVLPGWGQFYAKSETMGKAFIVSEVLLWGAFAGFNLWSDWLEDDFRAFAANHAGVDPSGKEARYFVDIGNFDDIFDYNQFQLRNRAVEEMYPETEDFIWAWDSAENRRAFRDFRVRSDRADNRAKFTLAAVVVNHVVSAVHATLAVYKYNKRLKEELGLDLDVEAFSRHGTIEVQLTKRF